MVEAVLDKMTTAPAPEDVRSGRSRSYAVLVLGALFLISLFSYIDRNIVLVLQVQLKDDLHLSDTQLGLLTGASFALVYTSFALPIAWLADRTVRRNVLTVALFVWSLMTALSGMAQNFLSLIVLRMGVAVGEAGCAPTTHSLMADYFRPHQRATAMAVWGLSIPLGNMAGLVVGGWLAAHVGWRQTFLIVGAAGICLSPLIYLFVREPRRGRYDPPARQASSPPAARAVARRLWECRAYRYLVAGIGLHIIVYYAAMSWTAPFYVRVHGLQLADVAMRFGLMAGIGGLVGTLFGGILSDWLGRRDARWYMWVPMIAALAIPPFAIAQFLVPQADLSWALAIVPMTLINVYIAPINATVQSLMPATMRALAAAVMVMVAGIVGMGIGPVLVGAISDGLSGSMGPGALRYAIAIPMAVDLVAAGFLFLASRHIRSDLGAVDLTGHEPQAT